jgi:hypothetical protein
VARPQWPRLSPPSPVRKTPMHDSPQHRMILYNILLQQAKPFREISHCRILGRNEREKGR